MKQYFQKAAGIVVSALLVTGSFAQEMKPSVYETKKDNDEIIIRKKGDKDSKILIEITGEEIKINGKPISEFKDEEISIVKRKSGSVRVTGYGNADARFRTEFDTDWGANLYPSFNSNGPMLGVTTEKATDGVRVTEVTKESGASKAGIKVGDVIRKINETKVETPGEISEAIQKLKVDDKVAVNFSRDGKLQTVTATLTKRLNYLTVNGYSTTSPTAMTYSFGGKKLGIKAQETEDDKGVKILEVADESYAEKAGLKEGDVITELDGTKVGNVDDLRGGSVIAMAKTAFKVKILRDGKPQEIEVKIPKKLKTANL